MGKIRAHSAHRPCANRLDPRSFERVENSACLCINGRDARVELRIMVAEPKCDRVRCTPSFGDKLRLERWTG
jgi:hypothetical protein